LRDADPDKASVLRNKERDELSFIRDVGRDKTSVSRDAERDKTSMRKALLREKASTAIRKPGQCLFPHGSQLERDKAYVLQNAEREVKAGTRPLSDGTKNETITRMRYNIHTFP